VTQFLFFSGKGGVGKTTMACTTAVADANAKMAAGGTDWSFKAMEWIFGHDPAAAVETGNLGLPPPA